jgi:hypothetical protein
MDEHDRVFLQHSHPAGPHTECAALQEGLEGFPNCYLKKYRENPTPFTWTKGPEHFQRIIEATKQYQAAHPKQPKQRKGRAYTKRD